MSKCGLLPSVSEMLYRVWWPWGRSLNRACLDLFISGLWEWNWAARRDWSKTTKAWERQKWRSFKDNRGYCYVPCVERHSPPFLIWTFGFLPIQCNTSPMFLPHRHVGMSCLVLHGNWNWLVMMPSPLWLQNVKNTSFLQHHSHSFVG